MLLTWKNDVQIMVHSVMPEYDKWSPREKQFINRVISTFREKYPEWMTNVIDPYLETMEQQQEEHQFNYSLLLGETQQGKSFIMNILFWILTYYYNYTPCFVTKDITSLREDAIDKLNYGVVNDIVAQISNDMEDQALAKSFMIKGVQGLKYSGTIRGTVPIYLMNIHNHKSLLRWLKRLKTITGHPQYPIVFIDEVHELYTEIKEYLSNQSLSMPSNNIKNHLLIHYIWSLCKDKCCGMVGITATPQRALTSDPEIYPTKIYVIPCVAPIPGLKRVGYNGITSEFEGADFIVNNDPVLIVNEILSIPPTTLSNGTCQIKFLNICTAHLNEDMAAIHNKLTETFSQNQIYVKLFCQDNPQYRTISVETLDQFFDLRDVPQSVITNGVMILIGKSREGAGITMKPSFSLEKTGYHIRSIDNQIWSVTGITDMVFRTLCNMESTEQLLRCTGWFDKNHRLRIWMPNESEIHDIRTGIPKTKRAMLDQYHERGFIGPESLLDISNMCLKITKLDTNDLYGSSTGERRGNISIGRMTELHDDRAHVLETEIMELTEELSAEFFMLKENNSNILHKAFNTKVSAYIGVDSIQLPWTKTRETQIIKAVAQPRDGSQWRVNGYGVYDSECLKIVLFADRWTERAQFGFKCAECDLGQCDDHTPINDTIAWWDGDCYRYATYTRQLHHKFENQIRNWNLDSKDVIMRIDQLIQECRTAVRGKNLYNLFGGLLKKANVNHLRPPGLNHMKWMGELWGEFKTNYSALHTEMSTMLKECEPGEEDALLVRFDDMMKPFFNSQFAVPTTQTIPLIKIKARLRTTVVPQVKVKIRPAVGAEVRPVTTVKAKIKAKAKARQ